MNCRTCGKLTSEQFCSDSCFEVAVSGNRGINEWNYNVRGAHNSITARPSDIVPTCVFNDPTTTDDSARWEGHQKLTTAYDAMYWHHLPGCISNTTEFHSGVISIEWQCSEIQHCN